MKYFANIAGTRTEHTRKAKSLLTLIIVNFVVAAVGFLTQLKIANALGKDGFGLIALAIAISTYSMVIIRFGTDKTLVRDLIHFPERYSDLVSSSLILRYLIMVLVVLSLIAWKLLASSDSNVTWGVVLITIGNSLVSLDLQAIFDSKNEMPRHAIYKLIYKSAYFLCVWSLILVAPDVLSVSIIGIMSITTVMLYLYLQYSWLFGKEKFSDIFQSINIISSKVWVFAKGNMLVLIAATGTTSIAYFNQLLLSSYFSISELGIYAASWMVVTAASLLLMQVMRVAGPAIARLTSDSSTTQRRFRILFLYTIFLLVIASPFWLTAIMIPDIVIGFLFNPEYSSAVPILRVLGVYVIVFSTGIPASQYLVNARKEMSYFKCVSTGGVAGVILSFWLIPRYGSMGAALAVLFTHGITIMLYWSTVVADIKYRLSNTLDA